MATLKKNILYSSILTTANYIFPLLTYPYVSRVLGVNKIGVCNFVDGIINYFILFSMMGIGIIGIREIAKNKNNKENLDKTFNSLFLLNTISTTIMLVILIIAINIVPKLYENRELMYIGALKLVFNYLLIEWLYKGLEDFKFITNRTIIVKCLYVVAVFLFIHDVEDYKLYYLILSLMIVVNAMINIIYSHKFINFSLHNIDIKPFVKSFCIYGFYTLLTSMYTSFNVAYLGFAAGETEVGYYTTATKLYSILLALFTAFTSVMLPRMSSLVSENKFDEFRHNLRKSIDVLFAFAFPLILFSTIYSPQIINFISGEGYEGAITPMRIVMPLMLIIGYEQIIIIQTLMPLKEDRIILRNSILGASSGLLMNVLLVGICHLQSIGSAMVWVISELVILVSSQIFLSRHYNIFFPFKRLLLVFISHIPLLGIFVFTFQYANSIFVLLIEMLLAFVYCSVLQIFILKNDTIVSVYKKYILSYFRK